MIRRIVLALILALTAIVGIATPVYAHIASPDTLEIYSVRIFENYREADDQLWLIVFADTYAVIPTEGISTDLFILNIKDEGTGAIASSIQPYSLFNSGFSKNMMGFYFAAGATPTWNGSYYIELIANDAYDWTATPIPEASHFLHDNFVWSAYATVDACEVALTAFIRSTFFNLQTVWDDSNYVLVINTAKGLCLTSNGEAYLTSTVYDARTYLPDLFQLTEQPADAVERPYDHTTSDALLNTSQNTVLDMRNLAYNLSGGAVSTQNELGMFVGFLICIGIIVVVMLFGGGFFPALALTTYVWLGLGYIRLFHINYAIALPILVWIAALAWKFVFQTGQY